MVSVAKPWLICGNHGFGSVLFFGRGGGGVFVVKPLLTFVRALIRDSIVMIELNNYETYTQN